MMDRRTFMQGAVASAALVLPMSQPLRRYKMGLQLYTMRAAMARDVAGTLQKISALGYQEVETYGFAPESLGYYGLSAKAFAQLLADNKLTTSSGHYDLNKFASASDDDIKRYVDRCIAGAQALGLQDPVEIGLVGKRRLHLVTVVAVDDVDGHRLQGPCGIQDMRQQRASGQRHKHFGSVGAHARAGTGSQDEDVEVGSFHLA